MDAPSRISPRRLIKALLPDRAVTRLRAARDRGKSIIAMRRTARRFRDASGVRVNVGCGWNPTLGWINLDVVSHPLVSRWDCRKGLPFPDSAVKAIFAEHFFEHLDYESDARTFLAEAFRCLEPGGVIRLIVPDAGRYLMLYASGKWEEMCVRRPLVAEVTGYRDSWLGTVYRTRMEFINAVFRQNGEHKYAYDAETLVLMLRDHGFEGAEEKAFGISSDPHMAADLPSRNSESLYVEARKPVSSP